MLLCSKVEEGSVPPQLNSLIVGELESKIMINNFKLFNYLIIELAIDLVSGVRIHFSSENYYEKRVPAERPFLLTKGPEGSKLFMSQNVP